MQTFISGNKIDCFSSYQELYTYITTDLTKKRKGYITVNNTHTIMEASRNKEYASIINHSYLSLTDGMPLVILSKIKTGFPVCRLFGPSVMEYFIDKGREFNCKHFFLGNSVETLEKMKYNIENKYPGTIITGMISPPFSSPEKWNNEQFIASMNQQETDFIWIGLGAPKQEIWMSEHYEKLNYGIMFGIGAGFDYMAGNTKHAPQWMKKMSLEWLFRLLQEPKRLWKRYFFTIPPFILLFFKEASKDFFKIKKKL